MQMKDRTKLMFADTLEAMLQTTPMEKVRVSRLCAICGTTTPTFYYYFHDKYELVAWMFLQDFAGEFGDQEPGYSADGLISMGKRMEAHKTFYRKAFSDPSQNSIEEYIRSFNLKTASEAYEHLHSKSFSPDQLLAVKYHNHGVMGLFREWLLDEDLTVDQMNTFLFERTPDFLKEAYAAYPYQSEAILRKAGKGNPAAVN